MIIVGISCYYHDSSISVLYDDEIKFAIQEERITRKKNDSSFPTESIKSALDNLNITLNEVSAFVFYEKPLLKFERLMEGYLAIAPLGFESFKTSIPEWANKKLFIKRDINKNLQKIDDNNDYDNKIFFSEHHLSHLASSFYPSPFDESLLLSLDGVGEISTSTLAIGKGNDIKIKEELNYPHSLGLLYSAFTYFLGFKVNEGEYKLMGLAPYGNPIYIEKIKNNLITLKEDGSFQLNLEYFNFITGLTMTNNKFDNIFGIKRRNSDEKIENIHMDIAASIQKVCEEIVIKILKFAKNKYKLKNLCLSGGVALNCVANGVIYKENLFDNIWIQPAAGDAGGSLGAALAYYYIELKNPRALLGSDGMKGSLLGPGYSKETIKKELDQLGSNYNELDESEMIDFISDQIIKGKIIGWFQGNMEFGPRALGNRSILGDPRNPEMQKQLNLKTKFREGFRPFAPAILDKEVSNWFEYDALSPYMLMVSQVKKEKLLNDKDLTNNLGLSSINNIRSQVPAITHVDYSARIQTVDNKINTKFYSLIDSFYKKTGVPILINTSFNINNEPIVCSPKDAYKCFLVSNIDFLVIENFVMKKSNQYKDNIKDLIYEI